MKKLALVPFLLLSTVASAESLEEKKFWKGQTDYVQRSLDDASEKCGVKFTFAWVDKPKLRTEADKAGASPNGICTAAIDEVNGLCRADEDGKAAVKAKIKGFTCGYAKPRKLDLKGGIVTYLGNNDEANFSDWAKPLLEKKL